MNTIVLRDQFKPVRIRENLVVNYYKKLYFNLAMGLINYSSKNSLALNLIIK